jgi:WD40 repeat protein
MLKVWDIESGQELQTLRGHEGSVWCLAATPDGRLAVSGGEDHKVILWDIESGHPLRILGAHQEEVAAVTISPDGEYAASVDEVGGLEFWYL